MSFNDCQSGEQVHFLPVLKYKNRKQILTALCKDTVITSLQLLPSALFNDLYIFIYHVSEPHVDVPSNGCSRTLPSNQTPHVHIQTAAWNTQGTKVLYCDWLYDDDDDDPHHLSIVVVRGDGERNSARASRSERVPSPLWCNMFSLLPRQPHPWPIGADSLSAHAHVLNHFLFASPVFVCQWPIRGLGTRVCE